MRYCYYLNLIALPNLGKILQDAHVRVTVLGWVLPTIEVGIDNIVGTRTQIRQ